MNTTRSLEVFKDAVVINYGNQIMVMSKDDFDALCREYSGWQSDESKALQGKKNE